MFPFFENATNFVIAPNGFTFPSVSPITTKLGRYSLNDFSSSVSEDKYGYIYTFASPIAKLPGL